MAEQAVFVWRGTDRAGRKVTGERVGTEARLVRAELRREGITAKGISKKRQGSFGLTERVTAEDIALVSRQMATMMRTGMPLVQAFDVVAAGARNAKLKDVVQGVRGEVAAGTSLASALAKFPAQFDRMYRNLVAVGEQSGALDTMLERIARHQESAAATKRKVKKALTYPVLVVAAAILVTVVLLIYVVPQFEVVFAGAGAELPAFTRFVIGISDYLVEWWWFLLLGLVAVGAGFVVAKRRSQRFRDGLDKVYLLVPIAGGILVKAAVARCGRTLATAVGAGVPLVDALGSLADSTGNAVFRNAVRAVRDAVAGGQALHQSMHAAGVFPNMMVQMVAVGEESGSLDDMLDKAAEQFEAQVDDAVDNLTALIEPLMLVVLGVLVGGLVVAMYLPVFQLGNVFE